MTLSDQPLDKLLEPYPYLCQALGSRWITEQSATDPIQSPFPLARWLRMEGFEEDLATIDAVLQELDAISGIADRRRRLRSDPLALMETLTELYFGAWLRLQGVSFDLPKQGADFNVHLGTGDFAAVEATTPRIGQWVQDLYERLHLVGIRMGYSASIVYNVETLPESALSTDLVSAIVREALDELLNAISQGEPAPTRQVPQDYPKLGVRISWAPSSKPGIEATISPGPTSPYTFFNRLVALAQKKARQLSPDRAGVLLVGTANLPMLQLGSFEDALRYYSAEDMRFQWAQLPNQIKHIILYSLELKRIEPFQVTWIVNPESNLPDQPGLLELFHKLFPNPLRASDDVSATNINDE